MSIPIDIEVFVYHFSGFTIHKRRSDYFLKIPMLWNRVPHLPSEIFLPFTEE